MTKKLHATNLGCIRQSRLVFANLSFQVSCGEILLVEGPNGCGKSSLLRLITGLASPAYGEIFWENIPILHSPSTYRNHLHYLGHHHGIKIGLTVAENIALIRCLLLQEIESDSILSQFQLREHQHTQVKYLSAGQKQRLSLAKLLLFPKPLWILDEPLTALDAPSQTIFLSYLTTHIQQGGMAIISSHHALNLKTLPIKTLRWAS